MNVEQILDENEEPLGEIRHREGHQRCVPCEQLFGIPEFCVDSDCEEVLFYDGGRHTVDRNVPTVVYNGESRTKNPDYPEPLGICGVSVRAVHDHEATVASRTEPNGPWAARRANGEWRFIFEGEPHNAYPWLPNDAWPAAHAIEEAQRELLESR